jgi:endonuclease III
MELKLPDINEIISKIIELKASLNGKSQKIEDWLTEHRDQINENQSLIKCKSDESDIKILLSFLRDLLIRAMKGERGNIVYEELKGAIRTKQDLTEENYQQILRRARYRWGPEVGAQVISDVVNTFAHRLNWDWEKYFERAEVSHKTDFQKDDLLKIKHVKLKVRDLALSHFNPNYVANDLHVVRVITRIGLLNYGFDLLRENKLEMGNNPSNKKNYLFLHRLVHKLSKLTNKKYSAADLDRIFWFLGKSICGTKPKCSECPIKNLCLTGQYKQ